MANVRNLVLNAFRPNSPIDLPRRFAGRRKLVGTLADALASDGSVPVIYGDRGLGKTSLALQARNIAIGDVELLESLGMSSRALSDEDRFTTFFIQCLQATTSSMSELVQRIINSSDGLYGTADPSIATQKIITEKINLKIYEHQVAETFSKRGGDSDFKLLAIDEKLERIIECVAKHTGRRVLFIIDELDQIPNKRGLAALIKNLSSANCKFMLVGIAQNIAELIRDHESILRGIVPVHVPKMVPADLIDIVDRTEKDLQESGVSIRFDREAKGHLAGIAGGFPWFVHAIGHEALVHAFDSKQTTINLNDIDTAVSKLAETNYARVFEEMYKKAVRDSAQRETVLRLFSKWNDIDIPTSSIYPLAHALGISNPSVHVQTLTKTECGKVLVRAAQHSGGLYSFGNGMFKKYVDLRGSWFDGVKEKVDSAWTISS